MVSFSDFATRTELVLAMCNNISKHRDNFPNDGERPKSYNSIWRINTWIVLRELRESFPSTDELDQLIKTEVDCDEKSRKRVEIIKQELCYVKANLGYFTDILDLAEKRLNMPLE